MFEHDLFGKPVPTFPDHALVAVAAADVDPLQSIGRPDSAPAAVVGGVGEGRANERKAIEAVMEAMAETVPVPEREP